MADQNLGDVVNSLSARQQEAVRRFIDYLKQREAQHDSAFLKAAEEFIAEHSELLRRLAQ